MKLHVVGSSSSGNGYVLESKNSALILECGVPFNDILKTIDFKIEKIIGGVCSHEHSDHAKYIDKYVHRGILMLNNVYEHHYSISIKHREKIVLGEFTIIPLKMIHDVECFGFLIHHKECGTILFTTDTSDIPYNLKNVNHMIIEANYTQDILDTKQVNHKINHHLASRIENSHLSFEKCNQFIRGSDLKALETITLIHLSNSNSHALNYVNQLQEEIGIPISIAEPNSIITLSF